LRLRFARLCSAVRSRRRRVASSMRKYSRLTLIPCGAPHAHLCHRSVASPRQPTGDARRIAVVSPRAVVAAHLVRPVISIPLLLRGGVHLRTRSNVPQTTKAVVARIEYPARPRVCVPPVDLTADRSSRSVLSRQKNKKPDKSTGDARRARRRLLSGSLSTRVQFPRVTPTIPEDVRARGNACYIF